jgi:hypothetical protein
MHDVARSVQSQTHSSTPLRRVREKRNWEKECKRWICWCCFCIRAFLPVCSNSWLKIFNCAVKFLNHNFETKKFRHLWRREEVQIHQSPSRKCSLQCALLDMAELLTNSKTQLSEEERSPSIASITSKGKYSSLCYKHYGLHRDHKSDVTIWSITLSHQ